MYRLKHLNAIMRAPKYVRACFAADVIEGRSALHPNVDLLAVLARISTSSVRRALQLTPDQRAAVRRGERPLVLPPAAAVVAEPPVELDEITAKRRVAEIVAAIGIEATFSLLTEYEAAWWRPAEMRDVA